MRPSEVTLQTTLRHQSLSAVEIVIEGIKQQIIARKLKPGDRLPNEFELCELYGVGRSSLRESIKILSAQGILELHPGVGTFVSNGNNKAFQDSLFFNLFLADPDLQEVDMLRKMLEIDVLELILNHFEDNEEERNLMHQALEDLEILTRSGCSHQALLNNDMSFHKYMARASKNPVMGSVYHSLIDFIQLSMYEAYPGQSSQRVLDSHRSIMKVVDDRDYGRIREVIDFSLSPWMETRRKEKGAH